MALTILLSAPFLIAFLVLPDLIMRLVFVRGAFTPKDADAAALVLSAYGLGLMAVVLIRSAVASFQAQGDTKTPMLISLFAVAANVGWARPVWLWRLPLARGSIWHYSARWLCIAR
jgi:putative peptidoglycan lipid II flippase